jgi:hypothetical protein
MKNILLHFDGRSPAADDRVVNRSSCRVLFSNILEVKPVFVPGDKVPPSIVRVWAKFGKSLQIDCSMNLFQFTGQLMWNPA